MSFHLGNIGIKELYLGNTPINEAYLGNTCVFSGAQPFPSVTFNPVNNYLQTWVVPAGVRKVHIDCVASAGYNGGDGGFNSYQGKGARVQCDLQTTPGETLYINLNNATTGYNNYSLNDNSADIRKGGNADSNRVIVAGGGGMGFPMIATNPKGGDGGYPNGGKGDDYGTGPLAFGGYGGTQTAGGTAGRPNATQGQLHWGGLTTGNGVNYRSGGGGYYGGGGGGFLVQDWMPMAAGGGGSSYTHPTLCSNVVHTNGYRLGWGYITISMVSIYT